MQIDSKANHQQIAQNIYQHMRHEYPFLVHKGMSVDVAISTLTNKLLSLTDLELYWWGEAVDDLAKENHETAPLPKQIVAAIRRKAKEMQPIVSQINSNNVVTENLIDYEQLWKNANEQEKKDFFITHKFIDVPSYVRYWFIKHHKDHNGWTAYDCNLMIKYWALPFYGADTGAMINKHKEIKKHFRERQHA
jgi:hypothetical protein